MQWLNAACESADPVQLRGALNWAQKNVDDYCSMVEVRCAADALSVGRSFTVCHFYLRAHVLVTSLFLL